MARLVNLSNQEPVYSPGAIISNHKQLEIAKSLVLSLTNQPLAIETRKVHGNAVPAEQVLLVLPDKTKLIISISNGQKYQKPPCDVKLHNDTLTITTEHKLYKFRAGASDIAKAITWAIEDSRANIVLPLLDCIDV